MDQFFQRVARWGLATAISASAMAAQGAVIEDHVLVARLDNNQVNMPGGYEQAYSMRLGTGNWPYPYINLYVDVAPGKSSYANIAPGDAYLTYVQNVDIVRVNPGDEISARTLNDGSLRSFVKVTAFTWDQGQTFEIDPLSSITGNDPDILLGFSYSDAQGQNPAYGWAHLRYTQAAGLTLVNSAMTVTDAGIHALTRDTISAVPEASTMLMLSVGLVGIAGAAGTRRGRRLSPSA